VVLAYFKAPRQNFAGMTDILSRQMVYLPRNKLQYHLSKLALLKVNNKFIKEKKNPVGSVHVLISDFILGKALRNFGKLGGGGGGPKPKLGP
jgi:hypothetical protein